MQRLECATHENTRYYRFGACLPVELEFQIRLCVALFLLQTLAATILRDHLYSILPVYTVEIMYGIPLS